MKYYRYATLCSSVLVSQQTFNYILYYIFKPVLFSFFPEIKMIGFLPRKIYVTLYALLSI